MERTGLRILGRYPPPGHGDVEAKTHRGCGSPVRVMAVREPWVLGRVLVLCVAVGVVAAHAIGELRTVPGPMSSAHAAPDSGDGQVATGQAGYLKHCARGHGGKGGGTEA